ncbi:enoyl-CoA hydratase/isomerase family protein [Pontibacillus litoralis]|uniref:3-hydroxyisobutyryl-CoA hydrolase n=1 Tax=Pontibacillus litoralis JSM 072002 TaxID=1385512 RepID=A0A0A5HUR9_9BACI|nr:enoyl-CoA hydratase/isomerase family protein [Pontibacillus litoralis]KGX87382.1 3-hydroxyisobutyryl-CoA hydrolase [Pontibacillus litoralis JSM 072002]
MIEQVLCTIKENGIGSIVLNRPKALNSLTYEMVTTIHQALRAWENDDQVQIVVMQGAGEKGFCAGGDIKAIYESRNDPTLLEKASTFFSAEYELDQYVYHYSKPIVACLDGIVMGGGVGLSFGANYKIVTDRTKWAMPEMNIGFFPDVGAGYFLNQAPGYIGRYLALTASVITASDVLYIHAANVYMPVEKLQAFINRIEQVNWHQQDNSLAEWIHHYEEEAPNESKLATIQEDVDRHFADETVEEIVESLQAEESAFAKETKETLLSKSPISLKVTLHHIVDCADKSFATSFQNDVVLAKNFVQNEDFYEGARSVLVDKDRNPQYTYKHLEDVTYEMVQSFFR